MGEPTPQGSSALALRAWQRMVLALLVVLLLFSMSSVAPRAGELIDHLPEVQLARSWAQWARLGEFSCQGDERLDDVPRTLWVDRNGQLRSDDEVARILVETICALHLAGPLQPSQIAGLSDLEPLFELLRGRTLADGAVADGGRDPIRTALTIQTTFIMVFVLAQSLHGDDGATAPAACNQLRAFVHEGETLELRWVGFIALLSDYDAARSGLDLLRCEEPTQGDEADLWTRARSGELAAALQLSLQWDAEVRAFFTPDEPIDENERGRRIHELELQILRVTQAAPLLAMATMIPLIGYGAGVAAF